MHTSSLAILVALGLTTSAFPLDLLDHWARAVTSVASASDAVSRIASTPLFSVIPSSRSAVTDGTAASVATTPLFSIIPSSRVTETAASVTSTPLFGVIPSNRVTTSETAASVTTTPLFGVIPSNRVTTSRIAESVRLSIFPSTRVTSAGTAASVTSTPLFGVIPSTRAVATGAASSRSGAVATPAPAPGNSCPVSQNAMCCDGFAQSGLGDLLGVGCVDLLAGGSCNQQAACCSQQSNGITVLQVCQLL